MAVKDLGQTVFYGCEYRFSNVSLPDGNGPDLLRESRQSSAVPIVLPAANDMETDIVERLREAEG